MDSARAPDPRTPAEAALGDASAALAEFEPASMLRPGHAFSLAPLRWGAPPPLGRRGLPARFMTELARYIPPGGGGAEDGGGATPLRTPGGAAPGRGMPFTTPPTAEPATDEPPVKRRRPVGADAAPALPARAASHPLLATWHPLLAPSVAWPAAPLPPRALILNMVSDAAGAALAYVGNFMPPGSPAASRRAALQAAPASPGDAEGAEAMLALLHGDGGTDGEAEEAEEDEFEEEERDDDEEGDDDDDGGVPALGPFALGTAQHQCSACGTCNSPMWRKHPTWRTLLCNACGLRVMRGRPPLDPGGTPQGPPRRLFHKARAPQQQPSSASKRKMGGRVNLGRAAEGEAAPAEPGEAGALRRPMRGWRPNPKFYGQDVE